MNTEDFPEVESVETGADLFTPLGEALATAPTFEARPQTYAGGVILSQDVAPVACPPPTTPVHDYGFRTLAPLKPPKPTRKARRPVCAPRVRPRARGHRPRRKVATRSSARSGDSGDGSSDPAELRLALRLADAGLSVGEAARFVRDAESVLHDPAAVARAMRERGEAIADLAADWTALAEEWSA